MKEYEFAATLVTGEVIYFSVHRKGDSPYLSEIVRSFMDRDALYLKDGLVVFPSRFAKVQYIGSEPVK